MSLKQLSQTSFTARAAVASSGHFGFARTDKIALRRTQACVPIQECSSGGITEKEASTTDIANIGEATWCCLVNDTCPRSSSRMYLQSPLRLFARIFAAHSRVNGKIRRNNENQFHGLTSLHA